MLEPDMQSLMNFPSDDPAAGRDGLMNERGTAIDNGLGRTFNTLHNLVRETLLYMLA